jgi:hypothetical protein
MQFPALSLPQVSGVHPAQQPSPSDRDCPLDTAGDRGLWHAGGTAGENEAARTDGNGSQLVCRVRPVIGRHCLVGKRPEDVRQCKKVRT